MKKEDLHKYQIEGVRFVEDHPCCGLFLSMGLGKSVTTLTAIQELIDSGDVDRVLVIAPKKVAESTWSDEVEKWDHLSGLTVSVILGDLKHRLRALEKQADIYVTSRDLFSWLAGEFLSKSHAPLKSKPWPFDMVVIDELTSFKSSTSKRFKDFKRLRPLMQRVVGLTGTPTPNGLADLWAQMYCLDMGRALGHSKSQYINTYFSTWGPNGVAWKITPKKGAKEAIVSKISQCVLTMKAKDYLELPPMIEETITVKLTDSTLEKYKEFERECVLEFDETAEPLAIASNAAVLAGKLLQYSSGALYTNDDHNWTEIHREKLERCVELIQTANDQDNNVLVFYQYQHDAARILEALKDKNARKYSSDKDLKDWNTGKITCLLTHPASTAYGLNLQKGGHIIIWYGTGWNAEQYLQGNARLARQGQTEPVIVYRLVCHDTMDENALAAVEGKVRSQDAMINALRALKTCFTG